MYRIYSCYILHHCLQCFLPSCLPSRVAGLWTRIRQCSLYPPFLTYIFISALPDLTWRHVFEQNVAVCRSNELPCDRCEAMHNLWISLRRNSCLNISALPILFAKIAQKMKIRCKCFNKNSYLLWMYHKLETRIGGLAEKKNMLHHLRQLSTWAVIVGCKSPGLTRSLPLS